MELKNQWIILIGIPVLLLVIFIHRKGKSQYKSGTKITGLSYIEEEPYFKKKMFQYRILCTVLVVSCIVAMAASLLLAARPYKKVVTEKESYSRDIILCMDISTSVDELNLQLVQNLKDTVKTLKGERFGIVIFNTSAVMLCPLTDDYDYVIDTLDQIETSIKSHNNDGTYDTESEDWLYQSNFLFEGTLTGNQERGSSLIGDGLATSVYNFPDLKEKRSRSIILSTDNDLAGTPLVTLSQAADICKENDVVVYGIGTNEMLDPDKQSMKSAVTKTGGTFYLQEESGTMQNIIKKIEKETKHRVKGKTEIHEVEIIEGPAILLFCSVFLMLLLTKLTKISA